MQFCILSVVWNTLRISCNWIRKTNSLYTFLQYRCINIYKCLPNKEEYTPKMTQRLIGAVSNKRMECPVFRISGRFCRKRWLYRRYDFLSRAWRHKVRIDNARKSAVFSQKRSALKKIISSGLLRQTKTCVVQDGNRRICTQAYQKKRNKSDIRRAVRYRQYAEYRALFMYRKMLMPSCAYWWQGAVYLYIRQGRWGQHFSKNQFGWRDRRRFPFMRRILLSAFVVRLLPFRAERKKRDLVSEELSENAFCAVAVRNQNMPFTYRGAQKQKNCVELNLKEQTIKNYTHKIYKKLGATGRVSAGILLNALFQKTWASFLLRFCSQPVLPFRFCPYRRLKSQISASYAENDVYNSLKLEKNCWNRKFLAADLKIRWCHFQ